MNEEYLKRMKEYLQDDYPKYIESLKDDKIRGLRLNTNYMNEEEFNKVCDFNIQKIEDVNNSFYVLDDIKFGFHPFHHAGLIYLQDPSAMLPVVLSGKVNNQKLVLDMCASPGGKTLEIASLLGSDATIFANEIDFKRAQVLYSNVERLGRKNIIVTCNKPDDYLRNFKETFDCIILDAPCSGEGMIRKLDTELKWSQDYVKLCQKTDFDLIDTAYKLLKKDGLLIYSTCTFSKEEDEEVVLKLINEYNMETLPIDSKLLKYVTKGFIDNTYRIYPFNNFGEGQFMCHLIKKDGDVNFLNQNIKPEKNKVFSDFCKTYLKEEINNILVINDTVYYHNNCNPKGLNVLNYGVKLGEINKNIFKPNHHFFKAFASLFKSSVNLNLNDPLVNKYLHGEQINASCQDGYGVIYVNDIPLGGYKAKNNVLNNLYPKGLRNF